MLLVEQIHFLLILRACVTLYVYKFYDIVATLDFV